MESLFSIGYKIIELLSRCIYQLQTGKRFLKNKNSNRLRSPSLYISNISTCLKFIVRCAPELYPESMTRLFCMKYCQVNEMVKMKDRVYFS